MWDSLTRVTGSGNTNTATFYTAYDPAPYPGISYYRLVETDFAGNKIYSPVCAVNLQRSSSGITLFPNPATNSILIQFPTTGQHTVALVNGSGQSIMDPMTVSGGNITLDVSHVAGGVYYIVIRQGNTKEVKEVLIAH
jgi:hypothetical protein